MFGLPIADAAAGVFFLVAWLGYHRLMEDGYKGRRGLSAIMNDHRIAWMETMSRREARIVDASIMGGLQSGTAFFASTSLLAIGGAATLLRATDDVLRVFADLPLGNVATRAVWEAKVLGLAVIYGYAFFKFAWAYRLFNYVAILIGATPAASSPDAEARLAAAQRAAYMNIEAGRHFTHGQRAFFFSFAYLGWFISPYVFMVTTAAIMAIILRRQFASPARAAVAPRGEA